MTTWESLLRGLVSAARARDVDHDLDMAAVIDDYASADQLEHVIERVPPELDGVEDHELGDPAVMTPKRLRQWLADVTA